MPCLCYVVLAQLMSVRVVADAVTGFENSGISSTNVGRDELQVISFHPESNEETKDLPTLTLQQDAMICQIFYGLLLMIRAFVDFNIDELAELESITHTSSN